MMDDSTSSSPRPPTGGGPNGPFDPSGPDEPNPASESPVTFQDAKVFFVGGAILGTLLIGVISVYQWLAPWKPALITMTMGAALSAAIAFGYCNRDQKNAFVRGLLLWVLLALPTVAWGFAPVRAVALDLMGGQLGEQAQLNVLEDPADQVLSSACTALSEGTSMVIKARLTERLAASPALGMACIEMLVAQDETQAASISSSFLRQWESALAAQKAAKVCASAPHLFEMSTTQPTKPVLPLTRCAVSEVRTPEQETMAKCCADALVGRFDTASAYVDALGPTGEIDERLLPSLFATMTPYAFRGISASRHSLPRLQGKLLRKEPTQDWLTELSCNGIISSYTPADFFGGMEAIAESKGCNRSIGDERGASEWQQICRQWAEAPEQGICPPMQDLAKDMAVRAAITQVHGAIQAFYATETGRAITFAAAVLRRNNGTVADINSQLADTLNSGPLPAGINSSKLSHLARQFQQGSPAQMRALAEFAPELNNSPGVDSVEVARDLLGKELKEMPSWDKVKEHMTAEEQKRVEPRLDEIYSR